MEIYSPERRRPSPIFENCSVAAAGQRDAHDRGGVRVTDASNAERSDDLEQHQCSGQDPV